MNVWRLIRRSLFVFLVGCIVLTGLQVLKGHTYPDALSFGALWAGISAAIFLSVALYRMNQKETSCRLCRGEPDVREKLLR